MANTKKLIREEDEDLEYEELGPPFKCEFCGLPTQAVKIVGLGYGLLHEVPQCEQMETMSPVEFLQASKAKKLEQLAKMQAEQIKQEKDPKTFN